MRQRFFEATNGLNWGKFLVARFDAEWAVRSAIEANHSLVRTQGWGQDHALVLDLQTGEGAILAVRPGGVPHADLNKHKVWVCPLFEPFLEWLYQQDLNAYLDGPEMESVLVELPDAPASWAGYRRQGVASE